MKFSAAILLYLISLEVASSAPVRSSMNGDIEKRDPLKLGFSTPKVSTPKVATSTKSSLSSKIGSEDTTPTKPSNSGNTAKQSDAAVTTAKDAATTSAKKEAESTSMNKPSTSPTAPETATASSVSTSKKILNGIGQVASDVLVNGVSGIITAQGNQLFDGSSSGSSSGKPSGSSGTDPKAASGPNQVKVADVQNIASQDSSSATATQTTAATQVTGTTQTTSTTQTSGTAQVTGTASAFSRSSNSVVIKYASTSTQVVSTSVEIISTVDVVATSTKVVPASTAHTVTQLFTSYASAATGLM